MSAGKSGGHLTFPYQVVNNTSRDILVMDALPWVDPVTKVTSANDQATVVLCRNETEAVVGKFVAPLPTDRFVAPVVMPIAVRLRPHEALEADLRIPLPLAETSCYFADLRLREYEVVELQSVILAICYWPADLPGQRVVAGEFPDGRLRILAADPAAGAKLVWQRFPTKGLQLFRRTDEFPRSIST